MTPAIELFEDHMESNYRGVIKILSIKGRIVVEPNNFMILSIEGRIAVTFQSL
jgi:hypothetical protein